LISRIAETGAVVSEVAPGSAPTKWRFLQRNRLIATMSRGTVVVEAGLRSGSLNTARSADKHSRVVAAVPGPVTSMMSSGCHQAIRDGLAVLVTDAAEAAEVFGELGTDSIAHRSGPTQPDDDLDPLPHLVLNSLPIRRSLDLKSLGNTSGRSVAEVTGALGVLELRGLVQRDGDRWRRRR
jgi:DNA processing protein